MLAACTVTRPRFCRHSSAVPIFLPTSWKRRPTLPARSTAAANTHTLSTSQARIPAYTLRHHERIQLSPYPRVLTQSLPDHRSRRQPHQQLTTSWPSHQPCPQHFTPRHHHAPATLPILAIPSLRQRASIAGILSRPTLHQQR